jgi:hypothetical protein
MELWAALVVSKKWHAYQQEATRNEMDKVGLRQAALGLSETRGLVSMGKGSLDATSGADKRTPCAMIFGRHDMEQHLLLRGAYAKATTLHGESCNGADKWQELSVDRSRVWT